MNTDNSLTVIIAIVLVLVLGGGFLAWHTVVDQRMARAMAEEAMARAEADRAAALAAEERARANEQLALAEKAVGEAAPVAAHSPLIHSVIFYVKKDAPAGERDAMIADCHKLLAKIPSVRHMWVGKPAEKGTPNVAVTDYHLALCCHFDDADGLKQYLDHPQHKEFVAKHEPHLEKVLVYDFVHEPAK
jgi:hypothetical protein